MKKIFSLIAVLFLFGTVASAQEITIPNLIETNPKFAVSNYVQMQMSAGNYVKLETAWIGVLKLPSLATFGGYSVSVEKCTDVATGKVAKAIKFKPNSSTGVGGFLKKAAPLPVGGASEVFYIDQAETPALIAKLKEFQKMAGTPGTVTSSFNYICKGGFVVSVGFKKVPEESKKESVWMGSIAGTGDMILSDFLGELINLIDQSNAKFAELK